MSHVSNHLRLSPFNHLATLFRGASKQRVTLIALGALAAGFAIGAAIAWHLSGRCTQNYIAYSGSRVPAIKTRFGNTNFYVVNQDTLQAAFDLKERGISQDKIAILDMANENKPGGYHETDARAQEEELIRRSPMLLARLEEAKRVRNPKDAHYKQAFIPEDGCLYLNGIDYRLKKEDTKTAITVATICSAALDLTTYAGNEPENYEEIMKGKIRAILYAAYANNKSHLVLGALGCGMFVNRPEHVAQLFHDVLTNEFRGAFGRVVFAILDSRNENIPAFHKLFENFVTQNCRSSDMHKFK